MFIVKCMCKDGYAIQERNAYRQEDIDFCMHEFKTLYPNNEIVVEEFLPWTKERAEEEIAKKLEKQKKEQKKK